MTNKEFFLFALVSLILIKVSIVSIEAGKKIALLEKEVQELIEDNELKRQRIQTLELTLEHESELKKAEIQMYKSFCSHKPK